MAYACLDTYAIVHPNTIHNIKQIYNPEIIYYRPKFQIVH